jgi:hypothetical protein
MSEITTYVDSFDSADNSKWSYTTTTDGFLPINSMRDSTTVRCLTCDARLIVQPGEVVTQGDSRLCEHMREIAILG